MCIYIYVCVCVNIILYMHVLGFSSVFIWDLCCCIVCAYMGREWTQHSGQVWVSWNHTNHQISWNRSAFWNPLQNYHLRWRRYYSPDICQMFFDLEWERLKILGLCYLHTSKDQMQIENQKCLHSHFKFNAVGCSEWQTKGSDFPVQHKRKLAHWKSNRTNCDLFLFAIDLDIHVRVPYWLIQLRRPLNFLGEHFIN